MKLAIALAFSFFAAATNRAQKDGALLQRTELTFPVVFVGTVEMRAGLPARNAEVVSSAGGTTFTDEDGTFSLATRVPLHAESVELSASLDTASGASLLASVRILPSAFAPTTPVGRLLLVPGPSCHAKWRPMPGAAPGVNGDIEAFVAAEEDGEPVLYAGGVFTIAGGVEASHVARWDGRRWTALGEGLEGDVHALAMFDDGSGAALYASGSFPARLARWDGASWTPVGGIPNLNGAVLETLDDGSGPALYATGTNGASRVAKWNGTSWTTLGAEFVDNVTALEVFDDGSGPALYAAGRSMVVGGYGHFVARWNGTGWIAIGGRFMRSPSIHGELAGDINDLAVFDDGTGAALYAAGWFVTVGGVPINGIARWDGASWSALGSGTNFVDALAVYGEGLGAALYVGGSLSGAGGAPANRIARWDGAVWSTLGAGLGSNATVFDLEVFDRGDGAMLYAGGNISTAGGQPAEGMAWWEGAVWEAEEDPALDGAVRGIATLDDGTGPSLYVAGFFTSAEGRTLNHIAKRVGEDWLPLGSGLGGDALALTTFDDGGGPALYVGGSFATAGGATALQVASWNGASWSPLGDGMNNTVRTFTVFDDGSGPQLYAGGDFTTAGDVVANRVAKWNGTFWRALGTGMNNRVEVLAVFDDGSGPALYAAGEFTNAGGVAAPRLAKWNGTAWSGGFGTFNGAIRALAVHDDGSGPALYVGGDFSQIGSMTAFRIARWDGTAWSTLSNGTGAGVRSIASFDDGSGLALYVGGTFTSAGGAANRIARWDGTFWSPLGNGMTPTGASVDVLAVLDDGGGAALYAGGVFLGPTLDENLAKWSCGRRVRR